MFIYSSAFRVQALYPNESRASYQIRQDNCRVKRQRRTRLRHKCDKI